MINTVLLLGAAGWIWIVVIAGLMVGSYFSLDRLMRKGIVSRGSSGLASNALSQLQTLADPAQHHVIEQQERKRSEHDDAGDDPDQTS